MKTIIVGAGIAGLYVAEQLIQQGTRPEDIIMFEKNGYIGGRIITGKRPDGSTYEIGAGRIHSSHHRTLSLLRRYGLRIQPIQHSFPKLLSATGKVEENNFPTIWKEFLKIVSTLPPEVLRTTTLKELSSRMLSFSDALLRQSPYISELELSRADLSIPMFEQYFLNQGTFYLVEGGLSQLIERMVENLNITIHRNTTVTDIKKIGDSYTVFLDAKTIQADRVILALHASALKSFPCMKKIDSLKYLKMYPLTRIYAQYPEPVWFRNIPTFISDSILHFTIPVGPNLLMVSYTDSRNTREFRNEPALKEKVQSELKRIFHDASIPDPEWIHAYEWKDGCSYWAPGNYDPVAERTKICRPFLDTMPELYICSESLSITQSWVEGALESADHILEFNRSTKTIGECLDRPD